MHAALRPHRRCFPGKLLLSNQDPSAKLTSEQSPSHLLFGAKEILEPDRLPPKVLIIAGGADNQVPYAQSVLLRTLFEGVGIPVRLKLYREETHLGSLASACSSLEDLWQDC